MTNEMIDENERLEALASIAFARLKAAVEETKIAQSIAQTKALILPLSFGCMLMAGVALNHTGIVGVVIAVIIMVFWYYFESKERLHFDRTLASLHTITDSIREKLRSLDIESPLPAKLGKQLSFKYEDRHLLSYAGWCCLCGDDADKVFGPRASHYLPQADIPPSTFHAEGDYLVRSQTESIVSVKDLESHLDYCKYVSDDESQLVCYSRLGFSPEAEEFAAANHIELVDLRQVIKAYQTSLVASFILKSDDSKER